MNNKLEKLINEVMAPSAIEVGTAMKKSLENMDLDQFLQRAAASLSRLKQQLNLDREPLLVLIVYEIPNNPCSERQALLKYFNSHGIECEELKYPIEENYE